MKKVFAVCLMVVMVISMGLAIYAAPGKFISSPSNNNAPQLIEAKNVSEDCEADLLITAYADREDLPADIKAKLEEAYNMIVNANDLSELNAQLKEIAENLGISVEDLAVSDLFDISMTECDSHEGHGHFDITLKAETLENFVCLLHYYNNEWHIVEGAEVTNNGEHLEFDEDEFSPFAIVVNTNVEIPGTSDYTVTIICSVVMVLSAAAIVVLLLTSKKKCK